jgi:hypothetical protein
VCIAEWVDLSAYGGDHVALRGDDEHRVVGRQQQRYGVEAKQDVEVVGVASSERGERRQVVFEHAFNAAAIAAKAPSVGREADRRARCRVAQRAWAKWCFRRTRSFGQTLRARGQRRYKSGMAGHRIFRTSVASVYPHYVAKAEKKGRTKEEVDEILCWLTGYGASELDLHLKQGTDFERFFAEAPALNPSRKLVSGVVCGVRVEEIEDPLMQEIRYLDKLVDELARGKAMEKILRKQ